MTRRRTPAPVVAGLLAVGLVALASGLGACDVPTGPRTSEPREVGDVSSVRLTTSGSLTIARGDVPGLTVTAAENVLPYLTSDVHDGVLVLGVQGGHPGAAAGDIRYELVLGDLQQLWVEGSGDVDADGASGERLDVQVDGSGDVVVHDVDVDEVSVSIQGSGVVALTGRATGQVVTVDGSGDYSAGDLTTRDATVSVAGSGDVDVAVSGRLGVQIAGSGSVTHTGGADVTSRVDGRGQVRQG
ncbi:GIN domain-containing protein [Cellulomonas soli]|uniref:GIN domain-containing protein n=1 Tax=Cellulomonas soli TaxID=931535 RepID=UPI003F82564B